MTRLEYDVVVLGGGATGEHVAAEVAGRGFRVAIVERELVGGECSFYACIPSKTLLRAGEAVSGARDAQGHARVDVNAALAWRDIMVSAYSDAGQEQWLRGAGIDLYRGTGRIAGPGIIVVGSTELGADHIIIATGSSPSMPLIPGLADLTGVWGSREATGLTAIPRHLLVLGGGPVAVEMAQAVRRLGAEVTVVADEDRVLPREPRAVGEAVGDVLRRDGITLVLSSMVIETHVDADGNYVLSFESETQVAGDKLLVATGRHPNVHDLGLETVGVSVSDRGIEVDGQLRAGEGLWAVGDVTGIWSLTNVGKYQGDVLAANLAGVETSAHYEAVPRVVFTDPQAAAVGRSDDAFSATVTVASGSKLATYTRCYEQSNGFLTLVSDGERLTGAYAVGPEAGEWLQQATLAIRARVPLAVLSDTIQPFPSFSELFVSALKALRASIGDI